MGVVVADTSPINYLVQIGEIDLLGLLFDVVLIPTAVHRELLAAGAPRSVSDWARVLPAWCQVQDAPKKILSGLQSLDPGERDAIALALDRNVAEILMDDSPGRDAARHLGLEPTGTLGLLKRAARRDLISLENVLSKLQRTNFRVSTKVLHQIRDEQ